MGPGRLLAGFLLVAGLCCAQEGTVATFGTTVVINSGLRGEIFRIKEGSAKLPKFEKLKPMGVIYTYSLNVPPREFSEGFPGVTDRYEWFAIDYHGKFWIENPGKYRFALVSDDGSRLYIDGHQVIDNDGVHGPQVEEGHANLSAGVHTIRVSYFQGPRTSIALILTVQGPQDRDFRIFDMNQFRPPANADTEK
jgi:hypothetical protein